LGFGTADAVRVNQLAACSTESELLTTGRVGSDSFVLQKKTGPDVLSGPVFFADEIA
jgi:hypothetical protein